MNFNITLIPQRRDDMLSLSCNGPVLVINGEAFDFSPMSPGDELPFTAVGCDFFVGRITCDENGDIHAAMVYPCGDGEQQYDLNMETGRVYNFGEVAVND